MLAIKWYIRGSEESDENMQLDNQFEKLSISSYSDISQNDDHYGLFEDPFRSLLWRSKSAHLAFSEKRWIYMHYKNTGDSINTISQRTGISISTIRRIILSFSRNVKRSEIFSKIRWNRLIDSKVVSKSISKFISSQVGCYTSRDVQDHIYNSLSVMIPLHKIRKYLKQKEHLSYKKGNPRQIDLDFGRVNLLKKLFWIKIADKLSEINVLINIDESLITRDTSKKYSWLKTGVSCSIANIGFEKSINLISAITTKGRVINMIKSESTKSDVYTAFLKYLWRWMNEEGLNIQDCVIILDNWSIYRAEIVRSYWKQVGVKLFYLPQYSLS